MLEFVLNRSSMHLWADPKLSEVRDTEPELLLPLRAWTSFRHGEVTSDLTVLKIFLSNCGFFF